jgi:hypothetical protein
MCLSCIIEEITGLDLATQEGHDELEKLGRIPWPTATAEMIECAAYVSALHENPAGGTGGPLHIVTDDNNVEDSHLKFCRDQIEDGSWKGYDCTDKQEIQVKALGLWILDLMDPMSLAERQVALGLACGHITQIHGHVYMPSTEFPIRERIEDDEGNYVGFQWGFKTRKVETQ